MLSFSTGLKDSLLNIDTSLTLAKLHQQFKEGDRSTLMEALLLCALHGKPMPDWVEDEILQIDSTLNQISGDITDLNAFFGYVKPNQKTREASNKLDKVERVILNTLVNHRWDGGAFDDNSFEEIASSLTTDSLIVSRRQVRAVYEKEKDDLKLQPRNRESNHAVMKGEMLSLLELAQHRRSKNSRNKNN